MAKYTNAIKGAKTAPLLHVDGDPTNYKPDKHQFFCKRCFERNGGICPDTGRKAKKQYCNA